MPLSRPAMPELRRSRRLAKFPLLGLPNELLSNVFSFLPIEDRLRVRVTKRLDEVELQSKYHVEELVIEERSITSPIPKINKGQRIIFSAKKKKSLNCIRRIAQNATIGSVTIKVSEWEESDSEVYALIKELNVNCIRVNNIESIPSSILLDLSRSCEKLTIDNCMDISAKDLLQVYKYMMDGSTKLREFDTGRICFVRCCAFRVDLGINVGQYTYISDRDVLAFGSRSGRKIVLIDGNLEMIFDHSLGNFAERSCYLRFKLHGTDESLKEAKECEDLVKLLRVPYH